MICALYDFRTYFTSTSLRHRVRSQNLLRMEIPSSNFFKLTPLFLTGAVCVTPEEMEASPCSLQDEIYAC